MLTIRTKIRITLYDAYAYRREQLHFGLARTLGSYIHHLVCNHAGSMLTHVEEYPGKLAGLLSASSITRAVVLREFQRDVAAWHAAKVGVCAFSVV